MTSRALDLLSYNTSPLPMSSIISPAFPFVLAIEMNESQ
jgi:hypothetical protein